MRRRERELLRVRTAADEARRRLRDVLDAAVDPMWCTAIDGVVTEWNAAAARLFGFTRDEIVGARWLEETIPASDRDRVATPALRSLLGGEVDTVTFVTGRRTKSGRVIPVESRVAPLRDIEGRVVELVTTARDVTVEQLGASASRALSSGLRPEEVFARLSDALQPFVAHDRVRVVEVTRDARWRLLREQRRVPLSAPAVAWLNSAGDTPLRVNDTTVDVVPIDAEVLPPWTASFVAVPLRAAGRPIGLLLVSADDPNGFDDRAEELLACIADDVAAALRNVVEHAEEREAAERLARVEQQRSTFVRVVAHEIRTPLYGVQLAADVLQARARDTELVADPAVARMIDYLHEGVRQVQRFVEDVVEAYVEAPGAIRYVATECDVTSLLRRVCDDPALGDTSRVRLDVRGTLGRGVLDDVRVAQLVRNLVSNALKFSPPGSPVDVRATRTGDELAIDVADTGIGIPAHELGHLFEPFTRLSQAGSAEAGIVDPGGSGLGLWVARRIAEAHGGRIWADSVPGAGSTFHVRLDVGSDRAHERDTASA